MTDTYYLAPEGVNFVVLSYGGTTLHLHGGGEDRKGQTLCGKHYADWVERRYDQKMCAKCVLVYFDWMQEIGRG